jgi:hypothetical protein
LKYYNFSRLVFDYEDVLQETFDCNCQEDESFIFGVAQDMLFALSFFYSRISVCMSLSVNEMIQLFLETENKRQKYQ